MKNLFLTAAILLGGLSSYASSTFELHSIDVQGIYIYENSIVEDGILDAEKVFKQIKASELPEAVLEALASDFNRATLDKAYVNAKEEYKLVISVQEVTSAVHKEKVYADKFGNWIERNQTLLPVTNRLQEITKQ